ncbi:serpin family protein [Streptomyces sp. NPDC057302]|uniref:serpin family protein n=1 Tax=Streptomyces sp. NPDC057302 TaxID=3346094 RepID=UPI00364299ED
MGTSGVIVRAVNALTARWAQTAPTGSGTVFSAAGVWPLLAFLAAGADGGARQELTEAVGLPAGQAAGAARHMLASLDAMRGVDAAVGMWTGRTLELREEWLADIPLGALGVLTGDPEADASALDAWASKRTGGQIDRMPLRPDGNTEFVLASALALRTEWFRPFTEGLLWPESGPWEGRGLAALHRTTSLLDRVGVAWTPAGTVTELKVLGDTGIDVHLLLGEDGMSPGQVLGAGVDILARTRAVLPGTRLPYGDAGPGLSVRRVRHPRPTPPTLNVTTVPFSVSARHDLLDQSPLFGLTTATTDKEEGHFPGIGSRPLKIQNGAQAATATFGALGFRAATVAAFAMTASGVPEERYLTTEVDATFDRPFGFLAVHRTSRLVLAAGWVTDPEPYREDEFSSTPWA